MTCPCHGKKLEERTSQHGWQYYRCPSFTCWLFCGKDQAKDYMSAVRKDVHPDICDRWETMNCFCGSYPVMKHGKSQKNPGRLYLSCGDHNQCKFFRWADEPVIKDNMKDPLAVHDLLNEPIADLGESDNGKELKGFNPKDFEYVPLQKDVVERSQLGLF